MADETCGLKSVKINGVECIERFYEIVSQETLGNPEAMSIFLEEDARQTPFDWTPRQAPVVLVDNNDEIAFFGLTFTKATHSIAGNIRRTEIKCLDWKGYYSNIPVSIIFNENTHTIRTALLSLLNQWAPEDLIGFVGYWNEGCGLKYEGASFTEVVKGILSLVQEEGGAQWVVTYDEESGKPVHNFIPMWQTHIGTIGDNEEIHDDESIPFEVDESQIKNQIKVSSSNVKWTQKMEQWHYFAYDKDLEIYDPTEFMFGRALAGKPENMQVFLLLGTMDEDLARVQSGRLVELKVKTLDPEDDPAIGFNILNHIPKVDRRFGDDFSGGTISRDINNGMNPAFPDLPYNNANVPMLPMPFVMLGDKGIINPYDGTVQDIIIGCYSDTFAVTFQSNPYPDNPETVYGMLSLFTYTHLKNNIGLLSNLLGRTILPDELLGYYLCYDFYAPYYKIFEPFETTSREKYGPRLASPVTFEVADIQAIDLYGQNKIELLSQEKEVGGFTYDAWSEGEGLFTTYPKPGQLCDAKLGKWGTKENIQIRTVQRRWRHGFCEVRIDSEINPSNGMLEAFVKRMESLVANTNNKVNASAIVASLKLDDEIQVIDSVRIYTINSVVKRFDGRRLWELTFA